MTGVIYLSKKILRITRYEKDIPSRIKINSTKAYYYCHYFCVISKMNKYSSYKLNKK